MYLFLGLNSNAIGAPKVKKHVIRLPGGPESGTHNMAIHVMPQLYEIRNLAGCRN